MSLITKNNYEAYLLDYVEENLSPELIVELMLFFENNPELKEDLEAFEIHELIPSSIKLSDKNQLKKEIYLISVANYEEFIIKEIEGLNTVEESSQLHLFLASNPILQKEIIAYRHTKLIGAEIIFEDKKALLQKERKVIPSYWWSSAAAAAIIMFFWVNGFNSGSEKRYFPLAERNVIVWGEEEKDSSLKFYVFDEESTQAAEVEGAKIKKVKKEKRTTSSNSLPIEETASLASLSEKEIEEKNDTSEKENVDFDKNDVEEEVLYAENSVKIVYVDELLDKENPVKEKKKVTKLDIFRKAIKQQVKSKVLDKGRGRILLALNSKTANIIRGRRNK